MSFENENISNQTLQDIQQYTRSDGFTIQQYTRSDGFTWYWYLILEIQTL